MDRSTFKLYLLLAATNNLLIIVGMEFIKETAWNGSYQLNLFRKKSSWT